jgi:glycosyltransferase involved in cell wall biosynthesis
MPKFSILFLTTGLNTPSTRFRVLQHISLYRKKGVFCKVVHGFPDRFYGFTGIKVIDLLILPIMYIIKFFLRVIAIILFAGRYDVVYIQRELLPGLTPLLEKLVFIFNKNIVFDFDDAIFLRYKQDTNPIGKVISLSRLTIAGNEYLADFAKKFSKNILVCQTVINTKKFIPLNLSRPAKPLTLGWIGSASNLRYLLLLTNVLGTITLKYYPHIRLLIVSDQKPNFPLPIKTIYIKWNKNTEVEDLNKMDIGLMPLLDTPWEKGKCGFKIIQYMACGIPVVASAVGANIQVLQDGKQGFLVNTDNEWIEKLSVLIEDHKLRKRMGQEARKRAVESFSLDDCNRKILGAIKETFAKSGL